MSEYKILSDNWVKIGKGNFFKALMLNGRTSNKKGCPKSTVISRKVRKVLERQNRKGLNINSIVFADFALIFAFFAWSLLFGYPLLLFNFLIKNHGYLSAFSARH